MATDTSTTTGTVVIVVTGPDGTVKTRHEIDNTITDAGDLYHVKRIAAGVSPAAPADVAKVSGMKLGTGAAAASKNGTGAALGAYVAGSNRPLDAGYPTTEVVGAGLGATVTYQATFGPGIGTNSGLTECVLVTDAGTDATSTAAVTIARLVFPATPKQAADTLAITWAHKQLGA